MFDDLKVLRILLRIALFPGDGGGSGFDHAIFDDFCFSVLSYSSHVIHSVGFVIKHAFTPIDLY